MPAATLLLPPGEHFGGQRLSKPTAAALGRGDWMSGRDPGRDAQLARVVEIPPQGVALAALARHADVGDAAGHVWLRAEPVHLQADINGVRMLAHGPALRLNAEETDALLAALTPLFDADGYRLDATDPARWYLRMPPGTPLPGFANPADVVGDDLFEHMDHSAAARHWRALANEAQIVLHQHPVNHARTARGQASVNGLWFWGGGQLPEHPLHSRHGQLFSDDEALRALAATALTNGALPTRYPPAAGGNTIASTVFDLAYLRDLRVLDQDWLQPILADLHGGRLDRVELDMQDGNAMLLRRAQRLRFWRKPRDRLVPPAGSAR